MATHLQQLSEAGNAEPNRASSIKAVGTNCGRSSITYVLKKSQNLVFFFNIVYWNSGVSELG